MKKIMPREEDAPRITNPETGEPIVHPAGTFETRFTKPGEIGYTPEGVSVTSLAKDVKAEQKKIGETDRAIGVGPAVIGNSGQSRNYEAPATVGEQIDLTGDVLYRRSNGEIVEAKAIKGWPDSEVAYIVVYEVQGKTVSRTFKPGELEAMEQDISDRLASGSESITHARSVAQSENLKPILEDESNLSENEGIITHVPGMSPLVDRTPKRGTIPVEDFVGDPAQVPGHPSNPTGKMMQSYADSVRPSADSDTNLSVPAVQEQGSTTIDPLDQLPPHVQDEVLAYRRAVYNKSQAEREKNFALAAEDGRMIYSIKRSLSPEAKQFLGLQ